MEAVANRCAFPQTEPTQATLTEQGITFYDQRKNKDATQTLRKATSLNGEDATAWHDLGLALERQSPAPVAMKHDKHPGFAITSPHDLRTVINSCLIALLIVFLPFGLQSYVEAQTIEHHEDREQGVLLYQQGKLKEALTTLRVATKKFKDDPIAWHYLGLALNESGDVKAAGKAFEKAIKLRPDFAASHTALAYTLLATGKLKEAQSQVQTALLLDPKDGPAHYVIGTLLLRNGDCHGANTHAEAAKTNDPGLASAYLLKSQAVLCDREAMGILPVTVGGTVVTTSVPQQESSKEERIASARKSALRFREAAENLEKYLQLKPNSVDASMWREQLNSLHVYAEPAEKPENERTVFVGPELTTRARVLAKPEPGYTEAARSAQVVGTVVLRAVFAADGSVKHVLIISGLPYGLTQQAIAAANKIKFIPATRNGEPASTYVQLEYNFNLY